MSCEKAVIEKALIISRQDKREKTLFIAFEFYVFKNCLSVKYIQYHVNHIIPLC